MMFEWLIEQPIMGYVENSSKFTLNVKYADFAWQAIHFVLLTSRERRGAGEKMFVAAIT